MPGTATERATATFETAPGRDARPIVRAYLAAAGGDPYRALAGAVADAPLELDACATALRDRDRLVTAGYLGAVWPAQGRP